MKTILLIFCLGFGCSYGQEQTGSLHGKITEKASGEALPFASISLIQNGKMLAGAQSDFDGNYKFENISSGEYQFKAQFIGYETVLVEGVQIETNKKQLLNLEMSASVSEIECVVVTECSRPLLTKSTINSVHNSGKRLKLNRNAGNVYSEPNHEGIYIESENRNAYSTFKENEFIEVNTEALSTFSIDVDHASYSIVRRHINHGTMPPQDAVRVEEMINYFDYDYQEPKGEHPLSLSYEISNSPWSENKIVRVALKGSELEKKYNNSHNLVFLLDVSGSMSSEDKLGYVKKSMKMLVQQLDKNDKVAIVTYAGYSATVLEPTTCDNKSAIYYAIDALKSGGSTNGEGGIKRAYKLAEENFDKEGNNRVILCTDGDFNVGVSSNSGLERLIENKRKSGVFLTVCGFGFGNLQDGYMETLADKGNGNYYYIDNLMEAKKVFKDNFTSTIHIIAKDVKIQVEFNPKHVLSYRLIGYDNRMLQKQEFLDDTKDAGELGANHRVTALYEIVERKPNDSFSDNLKYQDRKLNEIYNDELLTIKVRYKQPNASKSTGFEIPVHNLSQLVSSTDMQFALAVTEFGLVIRNSEYKGESSVQDAISLAKAGKGTDEHGYRAEFIRLMEMYQTMLAQN